MQPAVIPTSIRIIRFRNSPKCSKKLISEPDSGFLCSAVSSIHQFKKFAGFLPKKNEKLRKLNEKTKRNVPILEIV